MYEFEKDLILGETILYEGKPVPDKVKKNVVGLLFATIICIFFVIFLIMLKIEKVGYAANNDIVSIFKETMLLLVSTTIGVLCIRQIIYNVFLKNNKIKDEYYCITNLRVMKYNKKKNELVFGYIENYDLVGIENENDIYGDLFMQKDMSKHDLTIGSIMQQNPEDMTCIIFSSIENPEHVKEIFKGAAKKLEKDLEDITE